MNAIEIRDTWNQLKGDDSNPRARGFSFEKLIELQLESEGLEPKASYKPTGEQIDGSFFWMGQTFLLEAKWVTKPIPASEIYAFKGKLDGKFHTNSGVFLSVNGYSKDVEDTLRKGKSLNIILFLPSDIDAIFKGEVSFLDLLKFKLRQAGDTGELAVPYELKKEVDKVKDSKPIGKTTQNGVNNKDVDILVVSEYKEDTNMIMSYLGPILNSFEYTYHIISTNGKNGLDLLPSIISIYEESKSIKGVLVFTKNYFQGPDEISPLMKEVKERVDKSSISQNLEIIQLTDQFKKSIKTEKDVDWNDIFNISEYKQAINFFQRIKYEYEYDPIQERIDESISGVIESIQWDFEHKRIIDEDELYPGHVSYITDLQGLLYMLNDEVISRAVSTFPLDYIKECGPFNFSEAIVEYLLENKEQELKNIGWYDEL